MTAQSKIEAATLASAMALAFAEIEGATKDRENPAFKAGGRVSKYADINAVIDAIKPALIKHDLFFTQHPQPSEGGVTVETWLHHAGGEHLNMGALFVPANKNDAQGFGSALTYARRYALVTAFGVPVEDDDGNAAARSAGGYSQRERRDEPPAVNGSTGPADGAQGMPDAEWAKLAGLLKATNTPPAKLMKHFAVENLKMLNQAQYGEAIERLTVDLANMAKAETNKAAAGFGEILDDEIKY